MDITNLTKYEAYVRVADDGHHSISYIPTATGDFVKFAEVMEAFLPSVQLPKANIGRWVQWQCRLCGAYIPSQRDDCLTVGCGGQRPTSAV